MFVIIFVVVLFIIRIFVRDVKDRNLLSSAATFNDLLDAIAWVESKNNPSAIGDGGEAVGAYQIHKIYVDDINRILGRKAYIYEDRYDPKKSRTMVITYLHHYVTEQRIGRAFTYEDMARIHNGGPNGWKKKSTKKYWKKVENQMRSNQD